MHVVMWKKGEKILVQKEKESEWEEKEVSKRIGQLANSELSTGRKWKRKCNVYEMKDVLTGASEEIDFDRLYDYHKVSEREKTALYCFLRSELDQKETDEDETEVLLALIEKNFAFLFEQKGE